MNINHIYSIYPIYIEYKELQFSYIKNEVDNQLIKSKAMKNITCINW